MIWLTWLKPIQRFAQIHDFETVFYHSSGPYTEYRMTDKETNVRSWLDDLVKENDLIKPIQRFAEINEALYDYETFAYNACIFCARPLVINEWSVVLWLVAPFTNMD